MNLVPAVGSADRDLLWKYLVAYDPGINGDADTERLARALMECAINFYRDFIEPNKQAIMPTAEELEQLRKLAAWLAANGEATSEEIEKGIYDIGRAHYDKPGKIFSVIYRALLGQERGPRLGAFIRLATPVRIAELLNAQSR
jgi:lysyl-tRNA synthetase class 1